MLRPRHSLVLILLLAPVPGCHWILPLEEPPDSGRSKDTARDTPGDLAAWDVPPPPDLSIPSPCAAPPGFDVVARYDFEDPTQPLSDTQGGHDGIPNSLSPQWDGSKPVVQLEGGNGVLALTGDIGGTADCGYEYYDAAAWGEIPAHPDWRNLRGRIALKVRFAAGAQSTADPVLARDQTGDNAGDLTLLRLPNGVLATRLQAGLNTGVGYYRCTEAQAAPNGQWVSVEILFGDKLLMCVDGKPAEFDGVIPLGNYYDDATCVPVAADAMAGGLSGDDLPWVIGATNWCLLGPSSSDVVLPMKGAVDDLVIQRAP